MPNDRGTPPIVEAYTAPGGSIEGEYDETGHFAFDGLFENYDIETTEGFGPGTYHPLVVPDGVRLVSRWPRYGRRVDDITRRVVDFVSSEEEEGPSPNIAIRSYRSAVQPFDLYTWSQFRLISCEDEAAALRLGFVYSALMPKAGFRGVMSRAIGGYGRGEGTRRLSGVYNANGREMDPNMFHAIFERDGVLRFTRIWSDFYMPTVETESISMSGFGLLLANTSLVNPRKVNPNLFKNSAYMVRPTMRPSISEGLKTPTKIDTWPQDPDTDAKLQNPWGVYRDVTEGQIGINVEWDLLPADKAGAVDCAVAAAIGGLEISLKIAESKL